MGASTHTVDALRRKAPSAQIDIAVGDFACARVRGSFSVVAIVFNCILDERGLATQLAIFENASRHLEPGGCLVIEAFVLRDEERDGRWTVMPRYVAENHAEVQMPRFDIETGILERTLVHLRPGGARFISVHDSYAGPDALDVMAHVNGMTKVARYSSWSRDPFTAHSSRHITAYERQ